jgi:hypothetical protein
MATSLEHERDNIYRLEVAGVLRMADLLESGALLSAEIGRIGPVRLLVVLEAFAGWDPQGPWNDLSFYVKHGDSIERIAIVGDDRWRSEAMMFAAAGLRKAPVEFFPGNDLAKARAWLST